MLRLAYHWVCFWSPKERLFHSLHTHSMTVERFAKIFTPTVAIRPNSRQASSAFLERIPSSRLMDWNSSSTSSTVTWARGKGTCPWNTSEKIMWQFGVYSCLPLQHVAAVHPHRGTWRPCNLLLWWSTSSHHWKTLQAEGLPGSQWMHVANGYLLVSQLVVSVSVNSRFTSSLNLIL